jgi:hypothetical protein
MTAQQAIRQPSDIRYSGDGIVIKKVSERSEGPKG